MKYKYYFKKPKSEIVKDILKWLAIAGAVSIAATSPYFLVNLIRSIPKWGSYKRRNVSDAFRRLRQQECLKIERRGHDIHISLTEKGRKLAGWLQVDALEIKRPRKWDRIWRLVVFDISQLKRAYRDAFRGKLKELGFRPLQKSVWIHPFNCRDEIELLRTFFGLSEKEMRLIATRNIGSDDYLREVFKI